MRLAADGRRMAVTMLRDDGLDLWVVDLERGSLARRTFDGSSLGPVWSPDGQSLLYASTRQGASVILRVSADGSDEGEAVWTGDAPAVATSWAPDGRHVSMSRLTPGHGWDLWLLDLSAGAEAWLTTPNNESRAELSPDRRFLAYESDQTGRREVYLRSFPSSDTQWTNSIAGGSHPRWAKDGREIWFRRGGEIYSVDVDVESSIEIGLPEPRFRGSEFPGHNMALGDEAVWILEPQATLPSSLTFMVEL